MDSICNMMESTTMAAEQQDPRLQQVRIHSNVTAVGTEIRKRSRLPSESLRQHYGVTLVCGAVGEKQLNPNQELSGSNLSLLKEILSELLTAPLCPPSALEVVNPGNVEPQHRANGCSAGVSLAFPVGKSKIMLVCLGLPEEELLRDCGLSTLLQGQSALLDCCSFCNGSVLTEHDGGGAVSCCLFFDYSPHCRHGNLWH
ncbi:uncharacterized protein LOC107055377 isoform X2 [Gallus gallus]|uniref:uncharacterized protein LOC107055377 isoform X2 n=1 Tax=Gallus gallus TaxID=9031 RepID=UPI001AE3AFC4|nr:uncharacterized protein LOC107055377 isoform X2 [Gallus gallus]XP_040548947.1 uncharacterized protein LOC107055377 isoform X2 [Gallus gallus]